MINPKYRERIGHLLDKLQPLFWIWLVGAVALSFSPWHEIGFYLLGAYGFLWCVFTALDRPDHCQRGHTDIGFYYGRWSCRTCYRLEQQRVGWRAKRRANKI